MLFFEDQTLSVIVGDCRTELQDIPSESVQTIITSPPYFGLRDYGSTEQIGQEPSLDGYVSELVSVFREAKRVLKEDGTLWLNLGDSYAKTGGVVPDGNLLGVPWRVAFALQHDGWILRSEVIWHKTRGLPESTKTRPTRNHEQLFLFSKTKRYYYDADAIRQPHKEYKVPFQPKMLEGRSKATEGSSGFTLNSGRGRAHYAKFYNPKGANKRTVWSIATSGYRGAHFAVFPEALVEPCVLAGSRLGDVVLDPFAGAGTTALVANNLGRKGLLIEVNESYAAQIIKRCRQSSLGI